MTFGKKTLFSLLLGAHLLTTGLAFAHINVLYTTTLLSFCNTILLPGFLLSRILRIKRLSFWEHLFIIVGISIAFLEIGGLLLNILLPLLGVKDPLALQPLLLDFTLYTLLLFLFAWIRTQPFTVHLPVPSCLPQRLILKTFLYVLPVLFPILATLGAIRLNNGGSNILTLILLGAIAGYTLLLVFLYQKITGNLYAYALFFIGMASLFTTSLRSWFITGHDIEREFYVFQLTNTHHLWSMAWYQDAYSACLSITILPTVLTNLLAIPDSSVYKLLFQILFALSPVMVFFIVRNYTLPVLAFLSAFFFMAFPTFFNDMPMLNRQEIGFLFFGLALYMLLLSDLPLVTRRILFVLFALGVIISHYSTNFVLLLLVIFVYISAHIISWPLTKNLFAFVVAKSPIRLQNTFPQKVFLTLPLILLLFAMTYFWNTLYTHSSSHTGSVIVQVISSIFVKSNANDKSGDLAYSLFPHYTNDPQTQLQTYIAGVKESAQSGISEKSIASEFYSKSITDNYPSYLVPQEQIAPTLFGAWLTSLSIPVFAIQAELRSASASFMQIFVIVGLIAIVFTKNKKQLDLNYLLLCFGSLLLLAVITVLPALSAEYGVLRMFQQLLFLLSLPIVLGVCSLFFFAKEQKRILFTGIVAIFFFLNLTGFLSHLTGEYYPQMTLDNAGLYYRAYYVHTSDVLAMTWLSRNNANHDPVEADLSGANKLFNYGDTNILREIFPAVVRKNAYVYLEVSTNVEVSIDKNTLIYNSSKPFLDDHKNLIYSNGKDHIYK
jgi:uncharacterized membrane protein